MASDWKCCNCDTVSVGRVRTCECPTNVLYRLGDDGRMQHEVKVMSIEDQTSLSRLWQVIVDNTKGDLFWVGEILLDELHKETGYRPPTVGTQ